jgi:aspartyl-tRNA(Asn)/glutamyl-tRNA(Gln) amidotransferase subunit C
MKVTAKEVAHVANLANLELTEEERGHLQRDLNSILDYMDRLNRLDTANLQSMSPRSGHHSAGEKAYNTVIVHTDREDVLHGLRESLPQKAALQNAPDSDGTFFKVPKVIER